MVNKLTTLTVDAPWLRLQALRIAQMLICAGIIGGGISGLLAQRQAAASEARSATIGERLAVDEVISESNRRAVENLGPRVEHLENELGKLYGIGLAVGAVLGLVNGGQVIIAARTISAAKKAPPG